MLKTFWPIGTAAALACGCTVVGYIVYRRLDRKTMVKVGRVEKILIYPLKAVPGIEVESAEATLAGFRRGPLRDREFMVVDMEGKLVGQSQEPSLAQLRVTQEGDTLVVSAPHQQPLEIPLEDVRPKDEVEKITMFGHVHLAVHAGEKYSSWFRRYLEREDVKFVRVLFDATEALGADVGRSCPISFQNNIGYNILSQESIDDLNTRLEEKVTHRNFKPSLVVSTCSGEPYCEDYWKVVKVGDVELHFFDRCDRCLDVTVDCEKGICTQKEPLTTLRTYRVRRTELAKRKYKLKPLFAVQFYMEKPGIVNVGDEVYAEVSSKELL